MGQNLPKSDSPPVHPLMIDGQAWNKEAVMEIICDRLATSSKGVGKILAEGYEGLKLPGITAIVRWLSEDEELQAKYARAKALQMDFMADEIVEISNTPVEGIRREESETGVKEVREDMLGHRRLQVDTRKWLMSKLAPKKYGDKQELNVSGGLAVIKASEADLGVL